MVALVCASRLRLVSQAATGMDIVTASSEFCMPLERPKPTAAATGINHPAHNTSQTRTIAGPTTGMGMKRENELTVSGAGG